MTLETEHTYNCIYFCRNEEIIIKTKQRSFHSWECFELQIWGKKRTNYTQSQMRQCAISKCRLCKITNVIAPLSGTTLRARTRWKTENILEQTRKQHARINRVVSDKNDWLLAVLRWALFNHFIPFSPFVLG